MMKKHLVEGVVPVLIELKRSLEGLRHWLLGDLLTCIRALLKDHKHEVLPELKQKGDSSTMRDPGIEPGSVPWQGTILPLNQPRFRILKLMITLQNLLCRLYTQARCDIVD